MTKCKLCGEPLPPGEEMFQYHGFSGECPKPPVQKLADKRVVEYSLFEERDTGWSIQVKCDGDVVDQISFDGEHEARAAYADLLSMMRRLGAVDTANN